MPSFSRRYTFLHLQSSPLVVTLSPTYNDLAMFSTLQTYCDKPLLVLNVTRQRSYRLAFQPNFNLITNNYFSYINAFTLVHLSVFEFASIFV